MNKILLILVIACLGACTPRKDYVELANWSVKDSYLVDGVGVTVNDGNGNYFVIRTTVGLDRSKPLYVKKTSNTIQIISDDRDDTEYVYIYTWKQKDS